MTSVKRKRDGFLDTPNKEVTTDCETPLPPAKCLKTSLQLTPSSSTGRYNRDNPRGRKRRKRASIVYKSRHIRSKNRTGKSDGAKQIKINEDKLNSNSLHSDDSCTPPPLLNNSTLISSVLYDSKVTKNSSSRNLSSSQLCLSSLVLNTPTQSTHTPSKSSLKKSTGNQSFKDSRLRVSFERYVTVAEFSPDVSTTSTEEGEGSDEQEDTISTEEGEGSDEQEDTIEDLLSLL